ncbi:hypothetical protein LguiB_013879 [Lonicera macranthoides]
MAQISLLPQSHNLIHLSRHNISARKYSSDLHPKRLTITARNDVDLHKDVQGSIERIRERFVGKVDLSASSYDTAWVAMVPSNRDSPNQQPCFPGCLEWVMENQKADGSWGLSSNHPSLVKDSLSSTLACVLALQKWKVGEQLVQKGLDFIGSKRYAVMDKHQSSPIGFDIIFPSMINYPNDLGLNLHLDSDFVNVMFHNRHLQLQSFRGKEGHLVYYAEGLDESYEWKEVMKNQQRSNGSLFNSPATSAAALIQFHDDKCFDYLQSLSKIHGKAVPTIYPFDVYSRLCMVDIVDRLGINRYFKHEIKIILDETHRCWQQRSEQIILDVSCCALAFRLLRMNGYEVSSDALADFVDDEHFFSTVSPQFTTIDTIIHLYRASQVAIFPDEPILDKINVWTRTFLKHQYSSNQDIVYDEKLHKEVDYALNFTIDTVDRLKHRRGIELYNPDDFRMLKTSYRWVKDSEIMTLDFDWHTLISSYIQLSSIHFEPELANLRIAWTQNSFVGTFVDDMFDVHGSREELLNLIELLKKWTGNSDVDGYYCSKRNEIVFSAIQEIINEQAAVGFIAQGRCIKHEILEIRDKIQRKVSGCLLMVRHGNGAITEEMARTEVRRMVERSKREVLRLLVQKKSTSIPKGFIESFFKMYTMCYYLYNNSDEYRNPGRTFEEINALLYEPLILPA